MKRRDARSSRAEKPAPMIFDALKVRVDPASPRGKDPVAARDEAKTNPSRPR